MLEFTPIQAFVKGAQQAGGPTGHKSNQPDEQRDASSSFEAKSINLCKNNNGNDLHTSADPGNLHDAAKCNEAEKYYYISRFQAGRGRKGEEQGVVATNDNGPQGDGVTHQKP